MAQIIPIVSEALQSTIRRLLPSQNGFGEDLQAQNVIVPIIDLTPTAEGSILDVSLQQGLSFDSQTAFSINNTTSVVESGTGFFRIIGTLTTRTTGGGQQNSIQITNGLATKSVWGISLEGLAGSTIEHVVPFDFIVFLGASDSLQCQSGSSRDRFVGSVRQVATSTGELVNPAGFVAE
jgi:hypothetical protein